METQTMNIIAVIVGPIIAVIITLLYQRHKEKQDTKHRAFLLLMAHRKSIPPNYAMVEVLNTLDVIFAKNRKVIDLWHKYYTLLAQPYSQERDHTWLELLSSIAEDLHYPSLQQTDLDKFYVPQGHVDQYELQGKIQKEFLRVLENTSSLVVTKKEGDKT
ncbi:MAG: hypothetical protein NT140_01130 [Deltaproteobacteria bacterium]|nr:hypothetical protein [Deltaproteobacteria bacterium]